LTSKSWMEQEALRQCVKYRAEGNKFFCRISTSWAEMTPRCWRETKWTWQCRRVKGQDLNMAPSFKSPWPRVPMLPYPSESQLHHPYPERPAQRSPTTT
jgi:hypothetical protein